MNKAKTIRQGLALLAASLWVLVTPWATAAAVKRARWDTEPTFDQHGAVSTIRGDLLPKDAWRGTLDDRLPGGTYEPTVAKMLAEKGKEKTSEYWIGRRNRAHGLRRKYGIPSTEAAYMEKFELVDGKAEGVRSDGTWYKQRNIGPFKIVTGHRIYHLLDGSYLAIPTATIKSA